MGRRIDVAGVGTNVLEVGQGQPVVLVHGSGPGVTAYANWRTTMPALSARFRVVAPDMPGFGWSDPFTDRPYSLATWTDHLVDLLDALGLTRVHLVGNSFGGAVSLALAARHPDRVERLVLMGSVGVSFPLTEGLDAVWGYEPSVPNMRRIMNFFAHDRTLVSDDLAELRYAASVQPGRHESYATMFPAPRQRWIDALSTPDERIRTIAAPTLLLHGRDDQVIPVTTSLRLLELIPDAQLHVFGRCGHWTQIERTDDFVALTTRFLGATTDV